MATKKRIDRGKTVAGVLIAKVNQDILLEYLGKFGLDTEGSLEDLVLRLAGHQSQAKTKGDCDVCGAACDLALPVCPFCGTGDAEEEGGPAEAPAPTPSTEEEAHESEVAQPRVEVVPAATGALSKSLDDSVRRITDLKREAVVSYWKLGQAIFDNFEARLWSTRKTVEGKTAYHSWNQFVVRELGMSPQHSYALMDVAVNFTEEDVSSVGVSKLALLARVPPAEREALLARVRSHGLPLSQVAEEVRRIAGGKPRTESAATKAGSPGFRGGETAAAARAARQPAPPKEDQITVVVQEGRRTLQFVQKANPSATAVHLNQDPVAEELHLNGTRTTYRLARGANGLVLIISRDRAQGSAFPPPAPKAKKPAAPKKPPAPKAKKPAAKAKKPPAPKAKKPAAKAKKPAAKK
jgi:hypothetical protein